MKKQANRASIATLTLAMWVAASVAVAEGRSDAAVSKEAYQAAIQSFGVSSAEAEKAAERSVAIVAQTKAPKGKSDHAKADAYAKVVADLQK